MAWREDFTDTLVNALKGIPGIGSVVTKYTQEPMELPALVITFKPEEYEHGVGVEIVNLAFKIMGKIAEGENALVGKTELADGVIEKIDGINNYPIFIESTDFYPETVEGEDNFFSIEGYALIEKDFSDM